MKLAQHSKLTTHAWLQATFLAVIFMLSACGSSDDNDDSTGDLRFYNLSANSPSIYLTVDEDLTDEDDDAFEKTYTGVGFSSVGSTVSIGDQNYSYEMAFQDDESTDRDDLEIILEGNFDVIEESTQLLVLNGDVTSPELLIYNIPMIDDDEDDEDDLFNLQVLNMFASDKNARLYASKDDETFNEAILLSELSYKTLSDNQKLEQDTYVFYLVDVDTNDVLFESSDITFSFSSQYIISIRANTNDDGSPYIIDILTTFSVVEYIDVNTQSTFNAYNAIKVNDLLPEYEGSIILNIESIETSVTTPAFTYGMFSGEATQANGDYSVMLTTPETGEVIIENHLLTLPENSDKTIFFYLEEESVDDDGDGDIDENNDGVIDEIEVTIQSLVIDNSTNSSIFDHEVTSLNFIDSDDFGLVRLHFVKSNERIDTAENEQVVSYGGASSITLLNNTYTVFVVAQDNTSELILTSFELVLDENTKPQFIILENDDTASSGYRATLTDQ